MHSISLWAKDHKWTSRLLIIFVIYPLLNLSGFLLGDLISSMGINFGAEWYYLFAITCLLLLLIYPSSKATYRYRKFIDVSMAFSTFCLIVITGNRIDRFSSENIPVTNSYAVAVNDHTTKPAKLSKEKKKSFKKFIKSLRKKYREADNGTKALLIILTILVAIGLVLGLGALACSIACNGSEALALVVFILGTTGIIAGVVAIIRSIKRKYPKEEKVNIKTS